MIGAAGATWKRVSIRDIAVVRSGTTPSRKPGLRHTDNGTVPWIRTGDLTNAEIFETEEHVNEAAMREYSLPRLNPGTVLVAMYGGFRQIGRTGITTTNSTINQAISAIEVDRAVVEPRFVLHSLNSRVASWRSLAASSRKDPNISRNDILNFELLLPPMEEQQRIVAAIDDWNRASLLLAQLIAAKRRRMHGLMHRLLTAKERFRQFLNQPWSHMSLDEIFVESRDDNSEANIRSVITVGKYAIRPQDEHFTRSVASSNLSNYWLIRKGDFVYDPMSAYYGAIGRYDLADTGIVSPAYRVIRIKTDINSDFLRFLLKSTPILNELRARSSQSNKSGKRRTLQRQAFRSITVHIPSRAEQNRIADVLTTVEREIAILERQRNLVEQQKRAVMHKLLTREVRLKNH
jgi:type I restriction enzyme S subunit